MTRALLLLVLAVLAGCATAPKASNTAAVAPVARAAWVRSPMPDSLATLPRFSLPSEQRVLKNGLRVVVVEDHRAAVVQLRLVFPSGAAVEHDLQLGTTAFALALLGDRFDPHDDLGQPSDLLEKSARYGFLLNGAQLGFGVRPEVSWLSVEANAKNASSILKQLSQVIAERRHGDESFQARLEATVDALNEVELTDQQTLDETLARLAFGHEHLYARPFRGSARSLNRIGVEDVAERQNQLLSPKGATLLIVGDIGAEQAFRDASRAFGDWKGKPPPSVRVPAPRPVVRKSVVFLPRKPSRNTLLCLTRPLTDVPGSLAAKAAAVEIIGERLTQEVREKLGLTYGVTARLIEERAGTALVVCAHVNSPSASNAMRVMLEVFEKLKEQPPTEFELERVRAREKTDRELAASQPDGVLAEWMSALALGLDAPDTSRAAAFDALRVDDVAVVFQPVSASNLLHAVISGERPMAQSIVQTWGLGALRVPELDRIEDP